MRRGYQAAVAYHASAAQASFVSHPGERHVEEVETFTITDGTTFTRSESRNEITIENVRTLDLGVTTAAGVLMRLRRMRVGVIGSFARGLLNTFEDTSGTSDGPVFVNASGEPPAGKNYRLQVVLLLGIALR